MVGEMRDLETAQIAIQASLTGHLVLSTLHTNDSAGAVTRLVDMGVEPFLVSAAVRAFLAQRLVRKLCPHCKTPREVSEQDKRDLGIPLHIPGQAYSPRGCDRCRMTGGVVRELAQLPANFWQHSGLKTLASFAPFA